jgi:hypothetical protein
MGHSRCIRNSSRCCVNRFGRSIKACKQKAEEGHDNQLRSRPFFSSRHLWRSVDVASFSRVWQSLSCSQRYILPGVLVEQTLENQPTAGLGWDPFGDAVLKRTAVTSSHNNLRHMPYGVLFEAANSFMCTDPAQRKTWAGGYLFPELSLFENPIFIS